MRLASNTTVFEVRSRWDDEFVVEVVEMYGQAIVLTNWECRGRPWRTDDFGLAQAVAAAAGPAFDVVPTRPVEGRSQ